jgi:hypothetical protein
MNEKKLPTWDNRSEFKYLGSAKTGTWLEYGDNRSSEVTANDYELLLKHFGGRTVDCVTSRTFPQKGSLGEWLQTNVEKRTIASYVGAILVNEGYARKLGSKIEFL